MKLPISVIVLTYNEEDTIEECLRSVNDFVDEILVVDSFSTDKTAQVVKKYTSKIFEHKFENWGKQRNWAMDNLPINNAWVLHLDSDHRVVPALKDELIEHFTSDKAKQYNGFLISRKTIFMNRWIKHGGHYPVYHAVLFEKDRGRCEEAIYDQHFIVDGALKTLSGDIEDCFTESLPSFVAKHKRWAMFEAINHIMQEVDKNNRVKEDITGSPIEKRRYLKSVYFKSPIFIRPFVYFIYRYFIKLGFMDGVPGAIFHFMQGFWFRFLVDCNICKLESQMKKQKKSVSLLAQELYGIEL